MKKIYLFLFILAFSCAGLMAQTTVLSFNFDTLATASGVAQQIGDPWTTWSNTPGSAEDPIVSDAMAMSMPNSVKVASGNDCVLKFGGLNANRYQLRFNMNVTSGKVGYFNLLQSFAGSNSEWATQAFFNIDGTGTVDANGASAGTFTFSHDTWMEINLIIDLDIDYATMYIDGNEVVSWVWSLGSFGDGTLNELDAANFYGWSDDSGNGPTFYIDDVELIQQLAVDAPSNLVATAANNDIALTWDAPVNATPDSYSITRNNQVIASGITTTSFNDASLYPGDYTYTVRAHFNNLGYSDASNEASGFVAGGVDRNLVLFEINTGTWCTYCPGAAMGADDLESNDHEVAIIEYHNGDPFVNDDDAIRESYYNVTGFPTTSVDGVLSYVGGNASQSIYDSYVPLYNQRVDIPSVHTMNLEITNTGTDSYQASITIEEQNAYFNDGLVLRAALTESHIEHSWLAGLNEVNFVCRKMYPNANGTSLDFSSSTTFTTSFDISTVGYDVAQCKFVAFIQHDPSKEVVQTIKADIQQLSVMEHLTQSQVNIYPNPSDGMVTFDILSPLADHFTIEILNLNGQLVQSFVTGKANLVSRVIDLSSLGSGFYFARISSNNGSVVKKIQIQ